MGQHMLLARHRNRTMIVREAPLILSLLSLFVVLGCRDVGQLHSVDHVLHQLNCKIFQGVSKTIRPVVYAEIDSVVVTSKCWLYDDAHITSIYNTQQSFLHLFMTHSDLHTLVVCCLKTRISCVSKTFWSTVLDIISSWHYGHLKMFPGYLGWLSDILVTYLYRSGWKYRSLDTHPLFRGHIELIRWLLSWQDTHTVCVCNFGSVVGCLRPPCTELLLLCPGLLLLCAVYGQAPYGTLSSFSKSFQKRRTLVDFGNRPPDFISPAGMLSCHAL